MRISLSAVLVLLLTGCGLKNELNCAFATLKPSLEAETLAGRRAADAFEPRYGGVFADAQATARMSRVGTRLAKASPALDHNYCYRLLDSDETNAASLPIGAVHRVYITRGLYARLTTDELLAAVLAHEMAHLAARDSFKPRCCSLEESLEREMGADTQGAGFMKAADYDPTALIEVMALIREIQPVGWRESRVKNLNESLMPDRLASNAN